MKLGDASKLVEEGRKVVCAVGMARYYSRFIIHRLIRIINRCFIKAPLITFFLYIVAGVKK